MNGMYASSNDLLPIMLLFSDSLLITLFVNLIFALFSASNSLTAPSSLSFFPLVPVALV